MCDLDEIMDLICWNSSEADQALGIELGSKLESFHAFLQPAWPGHNKDVWENCAIILSKKTDEELLPYLPELLEWIEDLNWPGAAIILNRLFQFNGDMLVAEFSKVANSLIQDEEENEEWIHNLSILLENPRLSRALDGRMFQYMVKQYDCIIKFRKAL